MKQHYDHSISLMEKMLLSADSREHSNNEWDALFEYILQHFPSPSTKTCGCIEDMHIFENVFYAERDMDSEIERCAEIINTHDFITYENLTTIEPKMFPVAMAKFLLFNFSDLLHPEPTWQKSFDEFHARYGYMITQATELKKMSTFSVIDN